MPKRAPARRRTSRRWSARARAGWSPRNRTPSDLARRGVNQQPTHRGRHLVAADRAFATGGGLLARLFGGGFHKLIDRIDAGLLEGGIDTTLPDVSHRTLGGRKPGPMPNSPLNNSGASVRLVAPGTGGRVTGRKQ